MTPQGWKKFRLNQIADIVFSGVDKKSKPGQEKVFLCNYMDVYKNAYITHSLNFMEATASESEIEKFSLRVGDVLITKDSETPDDIGVPAVVVEELTNVICGYHLALIRPNKGMVNPIFLGKALGGSMLQKKLSQIATGATRYGLSKSAVEDLEILLPPLNEQNKISDIFFTVDLEVNLLNAKIATIEEQKKGLMQQLLTGRIRVPV
jgi:type I restriction enzyme, S subunit